MSADIRQTGVRRALAPRSRPSSPRSRSVPRWTPTLSPLGGLGAATAAAPALVTEPVLPVPSVLHGMAVGVVAVHGYLVGLVLAVPVRKLRGERSSVGTRRVTRYLPWVVAGGLGALACVAAPGPVSAATVLVVAVATFLALVLVGRMAVRAARTVVVVARRLPPSAISLVVVVAVVAVVPTPAESTDLRRDDVIGREGRIFLADLPDHETLAQATGGRVDAMPVRVYIGLTAAPTPEERAALAVAELERVGGLRRSAVLVAVPTGSGWVNPAAVRAGETLTRGDLATVVVQYAERPSWQEYLFGSGAAERNACALVVALRERIARLPASERPQLLVYGESLGAIAAATVRDYADAIVVAGTPAAAWEAPLAGVTAVLHDDDPVGWFSPRLLVARPTGWSGAWMPVVSFWLTAASLLSALDVPPGRGHRYGPELVEAWRAAGIGDLAEK